MIKINLKGNKMTWHLNKTGNVDFKTQHQLPNLCFNQNTLWKTRFFAISFNLLSIFQLNIHKCLLQNVLNLICESVFISIPELAMVHFRGKDLVVSGKVLTISELLSKVNYVELKDYLLAVYPSKDQIFLKQRIGLMSIRCQRCLRY